MAKYELNTDLELIQLLKIGNRQAFNKIYFRYSSDLYHYAFNVLRDEEECTDAVQDIFVWLWENREKINIVSLKGYLMAAIKYKLTRVILASRRKNEILSKRMIVEEAFEDDSMDIKELKIIINDFVNTLPTRAKAIYKMSREGYLTNREIASQLGISEKTVENQMTITLRKLRLYLGRMSFWSVFL